MLQISATRTLEVGGPCALHRDFPPEFKPDPGSAFVFEWEWKIADTEVSDWVSLGLTSEPRNLLRFNGYAGVLSHTRLTLGWCVLFDPASEWMHHRVTLADLFLPQTLKPPVRITGVNLHFQDPVRQTVELSRLRIEEWPHGSLPDDPVFLPHRAPPPPVPFRTTPLGSLRLATAGALEDLDGDGLPELLALERGGYAHLYRNDGRGRFTEELTPDSGPELSTLGTGAMLIDLDGDGDRDLVTVGEYDTPRAFENTGGLRFRERTLVSDTRLGFWYTGAADDIDGDGRPDLLFAAPCPVANTLLVLRNVGRWSFLVDGRIDTGRLVSGGSPFSAAAADIDRDGFPEVFFGLEYFLKSRRGSLQIADSPWTPVARQKTEGEVLADFNGDEMLDLLIVRDESETSTGFGTRFLLGDGHGRFDDRTREAGFPGLHATEVVLAEDFDNDGDIDLYFCQSRLPNYLLLNDGTGHFRDATEESGFIDDGACDSAVAADLDGDGGMDIGIFRYGLPPRLLFNGLPRGNWVGVDVVGLAPGTDGIGTEITAKDRETGRALETQWVRRGKGFGSVGPSELRFGIGPRTAVDLDVRFRSGATRRMTGIRAGSSIRVAQDDGGFLSEARGHLAEFRFPWVRAFRRAQATVPALPWLIVLVALTTGCLAASVRGFRAAGALLLLVGASGSLLLGPAPGRGLGGAPLLLWLLGAVGGAAAPRLRTAVPRWTRRLRRSSESAVVSPEDLIRFSHDFRHAGVETRLLVSIHGRVQNLFLDDRLHLPFLSELHDLGRRFRANSSSRVEQLLTMTRSAFPDVTPLKRVDTAAKRLGQLLLDLESSSDDPEKLRQWRNGVLPVLDALRDGLSALMDDIDRRCSCDVAAVLAQTLENHVDTIRERHIEVEIRRNALSDGSLALITGPDLLLVLENLVTNAIFALLERREKRIVIVLHEEQRRIVLEFQDSGPGVPEDVAEGIFDHGFSTRPGGGGYGLPRSREILGHYGGCITLARTEPGAGACFVVSLRSMSAT